ncbi:MAG: anthranilate phosphoribosyltransferase [Verrucomicrobiota bacterium]
MLDLLIQHCRSGQDLDAGQCTQAVEQLLDPECSEDLKADFLIALTDKGETPGELAGFVDVLLPRACDPGLKGDFGGSALFDCCGTGGGKLDLINVSTALMFILAAAGVPVVKHGNRGITKKSGSADVLETLGRDLDADPAGVAVELKRAGMAFCFAPAFHPAFKNIAPVRKKLGAEGRRTIFNFLGPLLNPCAPDTQMIGVFRKEYLSLFSESLALLGRKRYLVVYGEDGDGRAIGEVSSIGPTRLVGALDGETVDREIYGMTSQPVDEFLVNGAEESAARLRGVFAGEDTGPLRELLAINAGVGLLVNGAVDSISDGESRALELIKSGEVQEQLNRWLD